MEVLVRQVALHPESKLAKIKPEKLDKTTIGKICISYMSGKKHQAPKNKKQKLRKLSGYCGNCVHFAPVKIG